MQNDQFRLNIDILRREAETVFQQVARESQIYVTRGAVSSVNEIMRLRYPAILAAHRAGRINLALWRRHVQHVGRAVANAMRENRLFYVHTPRRFIKIALPIIESYEYEESPSIEG